MNTNCIKDYVGPMKDLNKGTAAWLKTYLSTKAEEKHLIVNLNVTAAELKVLRNVPTAGSCHHHVSQWWCVCGDVVFVVR